MGNDMSKSNPSTPTRVTTDIFETAAAVAAQDHRSAAEQTNHWVRIGMQVERSGTLAHRKVREVAAGRAQFGELTDPDRQIAHALIDAGMSERSASARFGRAARAEGKRTVSLDGDGALIEISPDGTTRLL